VSPKIAQNCSDFGNKNAENAEIVKSADSSAEEAGYKKAEGASDAENSDDGHCPDQPF
jgi:hypothetical protein